MLLTSSWRNLLQLLEQRWFIWSLFLINLLGSIYGFYWYKAQLIATDSWLNLFVPDSPTASLAFTFVLLLFALGKRNPLLEAFAAVTLFKYGIWAVLIIILGTAMGSGSFFSNLHWTDWMLSFSHLGMALQALLYVRLYTFRWSHLVWVGCWTLLNDLLDYGWNIHPWLPSVLYSHIPFIATLTTLLSVISLMIFATFHLYFKKSRSFSSLVK
ncbi:DUF1405 domain-containing protein [Mechercharimyces sp. CAU 1602]|uniref:DUF1405 domain-containing protein n=1 Tax=Mechercharimyces sp. CAU 1602 TaxID=2973933 RepID=UPI002162AD53|nr:DUF1405 domain-containing protein [Mechercharimyces sp. CAU 1602]MCS1351004.1 DUF1405 domain-containing protein [Mechercharimyces sp. CAU 1602]